MNAISRFLSADGVVLDLDVTDKTRALEEAASLVESLNGVKRASVFRALWRRELSAPTGVGHGVAIPHARISGIDEPVLLFLRTRLPIKFGSPDRAGVSLLLVILVPENATEEHLQILATASEMFSDAAFRGRMAAATNPADVRRLVDGWDAPLAGEMTPDSEHPSDR